MHKKEVSVLKSIIFLTMILIVAIFSSFNVAAPLSCEYKNVPCSPGQVKVLGLSDVTNAHAEIPSQSNYLWNICCDVPGAVLSTSCVNAQVNFTGLNSPDGTGITNAHLYSSDWFGVFSPSQACLSASPGTIACRPATAGGCPADTVCLSTQNSDDNAHGADCTGGGAYAFNVCCGYFASGCCGLGQPCCGGGTCCTGVCVGNTCTLIVIPSGTNSTIWGYVTNVSGEPVVGATVEAYKKNISVAGATGYYELKFGNVTESPYSLIASEFLYEPYIISPYYLFKGLSIRQDFLMSRAKGDCNDDCTSTVTRLCDAKCHGKGLCWFDSDEVKAACDGTFGLIELPGGRFVDCCNGEPYVPLKAQVSVPGENVITTKSLVLYKGKLVNMVVVLFNN